MCQKTCSGANFKDHIALFQLCRFQHFFYDGTFDYEVLADSPVWPETIGVHLVLKLFEKAHELSRKRNLFNCFRQSNSKGFFDGGLTNRKCLSSFPSSSSIILFVIIWTGFGIKWILFSMSANDPNLSCSLCLPISSMCFLPRPGSSSSWCLLIVIGLETLKKSTYFCSFSIMIFSIALSISAMLLFVSSS